MPDNPNIRFAKTVLAEDIRPIVTRLAREGVETFEAATSPELARLLAGWQEAHPDRHIVRALARYRIEGARVDVQWRVEE